MVHHTRYIAGMTLTRLVLLVMAVMVVLFVARTVFAAVDDRLPRPESRSAPYPPTLSPPPSSRHDGQQPEGDLNKTEVRLCTALSGRVPGTPTADLLLQNTVSFGHVRQHVPLRRVQPTGNREQQYLEVLGVDHVRELTLPPSGMAN